MSKQQKTDRVEKLARVGELFAEIKNQVEELAPDSRFREASMKKLEQAEASAMRAIFSDTTRTTLKEKPHAEVSA